MTIESQVDDGMSFVEDFLAHYGVPGMKWGVRKNRGRSKVALSTAPGQRVKATGGTGQSAHPDAVRAAVRKQKAKESTTDALSDKELKALINRLQMEQQYSQLKPKTPTQKTMNFVGSLLLGVGKQQATAVVATVAAQQVAKVVKKK